MRTASLRFKQLVAWCWVACLQQGGPKVSTYLLVHGAWHTGKELESVAKSISSTGHTVHTPTVKGNRPGDPKSIGLAQAIESIIDYFTRHELEDVVLVGHSYGGMIITAVADRFPRRIRRGMPSFPMTVR